MATNDGTSSPFGWNCCCDEPGTGTTPSILVTTAKFEPIQFIGTGTGTVTGTGAGESPTPKVVWYKDETEGAIINAASVDGVPTLSIVEARAISSFSGGDAVVCYAFVRDNDTGVGTDQEAVFGVRRRANADGAEMWEHDLSQAGEGIGSGTGTGGPGLEPMDLCVDDDDDVYVSCFLFQTATLDTDRKFVLRKLSGSSGDEVLSAVVTNIGTTRAVQFPRLASYGDFIYAAVSMRSVGGLYRWNIRKYDKDLVEQVGSGWPVGFASFTSTTITSISIDSSGGIYVGYVIAGTPGSMNVRKYSLSGTVTWTRTINSGNVASTTAGSGVLVSAKPSGGVFATWARQPPVPNPEVKGWNELDNSGVIIDSHSVDGGLPLAIADGRTALLTAGLEYWEYGTKIWQTPSQSQPDYVYPSLFDGKFAPGLEALVCGFRQSVG